MAIPIVRVILYVKDIPKVAKFYQRHFGMSPMPSDEKGWLKMTGNPGGCTIALHRQARHKRVEQLSSWYSEWRTYANSRVKESGKV